MAKTTRKTQVKKQAKAKALESSISSTERLEKLLAETEREMESIQPEIDKLEKQIEKLKSLKLTKQKLITLKLSIKSILSNFNKTETPLIATGVTLIEGDVKASEVLNLNNLNTSQASVDTSKTFLPDLAFQQADEILKRKNSMNYELFRAIVFNGGRASTEQLKAYLVENHITQPGTGRSFEDVELTDISSRANYLIRKGLVQSDGRGLFISTLGWEEDAQ